jgi:hypothetical protein
MTMPHGIYPDDFAAICKPDAGKQWEPSNGTEGEIFLSSWCGECQRDKAMRDGVDLDECDDNERCDIIAASFRGEAKEWQYDKDGQPCCIEFVPKGERIPTPRCPNTMELPGIPLPAMGKSSE